MQSTVVFVWNKDSDFVSYCVRPLNLKVFMVIPLIAEVARESKVRERSQHYLQDITQLPE